MRKWYVIKVSTLGVHSRAVDQSGNYVADVVSLTDFVPDILDDADVVTSRSHSWDVSDEDSFAIRWVNGHGLDPNQDTVILQLWN